MADCWKCDLCGQLIESRGLLKGIEITDIAANIKLYQDLCSNCHKWLTNSLRTRKQEKNNEKKDHLNPDWPDNILPYRIDVGPTGEGTNGAPGPLQL